MRTFLKTVVCTLLVFSLSACGASPEDISDSDTGILPETQESEIQPESLDTIIPSEKSESQETKAEEDEALRIQVQDSTHTIIFELNDSPAARTLYDQLPLTTEVQDYSTNEKIFYPPESLDTDNAVEGKGPAGSLAYFSPWGNVVMYYSEYGPYNGLYHLGNAVSGEEWISELTGTIQIQQFVEK